MTTTTITPAVDLQQARSRNEAIWTQSAAALYAGRIDEFLAYWHENGRYEVAYPIEGLPAVVQGHEELGGLFAGFGSAAKSIAVRDVHFHQTADPDVVFIEERMVAELHDGGRYENRLVIRATFRDGRIAELFEYYGERAHLELLRRIGFVS